MSIRRAAAATISQRAVHMTIVPRPANLAESREVLRVLQRFGPMDMYKHLKVGVTFHQLLSFNSPYVEVFPSLCDCLEAVIPLKGS